MKKIALALAICVFIHAEEILQTTQTQNGVNENQQAITNTSSNQTQNPINQNENKLTQTLDNAPQVQNTINQNTTQTQNSVNENQQAITNTENQTQLQGFSKKSTFNWLIGMGIFQGLGYWEHLRGGGINILIGE